MVRAYVNKEKARNKAEWQRTAFALANLLNASGKVFKRRVRWESLMPKFDDATQTKAVDAEQRKKEMEESFKQHKKKFWMKIKGPTEDKVRIFGQDENDPLVQQIKKWSAKVPSNIPPELARFLDHQ